MLLAMAMAMGDSIAIDGGLIALTVTLLTHAIAYAYTPYLYPNYILLHTCRTRPLHLIIPLSSVSGDGPVCTTTGHAQG